MGLIILALVFRMCWTQTFRHSKFFCIYLEPFQIDSRATEEVKNKEQGQTLVLSDALAVQSQGLRVLRSKGFKS